MKTVVGILVPRQALPGLIVNYVRSTFTAKISLY
jgi:hypothetical protein